MLWIQHWDCPSSFKNLNKKPGHPGWCFKGMRLTADLIERSASFMNACRERELDLRGNRIPAIENFGAIRDQYDTIDLTDNEIRKLENFPKMTRLRTLLISSNQIARVEPEVSAKLAALEMLVLNNNNIVEFEDVLEGLEGCRTLRYLSLMDNPLTKKPHYRLTVISRLPQLRCLDFRKVTRSEREAAQELLAGYDGKTLKRGRKPATSESSAEESKSKRQKKLNEADIANIKEQIKKAESMEEIARLEKILETGYSIN